MALTTPAVAVKVPLLDPALMVALAGTLSAAAALLDRFTVAALAVAFVSVTVQVALWPVPNVTGAQLSDDSCAGAARFSVKVCELLLALAVTTAVWSVTTDPTVAVKTAVVAPAGTVTLAGTVALALLLESDTAKPPVGAAALDVTVQEEDPGAFTVPGEQLTVFNVTGGESCMIVIAAPAPRAGIGALDGSVASTPVSVTGELVLVVPGAIVKVAWATDPFAMAVLFSPKRTHVVLPPTPEHDRLLPAVIAAESTATATPFISEGE